MPLFDPLQLALLTTEVIPNEGELVEKLRVLQKLQDRYADGSMQVLVETRVEQSFNERLFAEVFDYQTLLRDGVGRYHLNPKLYAGGAYDDFSLGFFGGGDPDERRVSAELKSPHCDLDAVQTGRTGAKRVSPVEQAHGDAADGCQWIIVSNYDEMRLYRKGDMSACEVVWLTRIDTLQALRKAYALFGRRSLLGERDRRGALEQLLEGNHMLDPHATCARLTHETTLLARPAIDDELLELNQIDDCLTQALSATHESLKEAGYRSTLPERATGNLVDGGLMISYMGDEPGDRGAQIEARRSGILRVTEHVGIAGADRILDTIDMLQRMAFFLVFSKHYFEKLRERKLQVRWMLDDIANAKLRHPRGWVGGDLSDLKCEGVERTSHPWLDIDTADDPPKFRISKLTRALREIVFPFSGTNGADPHMVYRLRPTDEDVKQVLGPIVS